MKKYIFFILLCLLNIQSLFSFNNYEHQLLFIIPIGEKDGEVGFDINALEVAGRIHPLSFSISPDGYIFIADIVNKRIVIFKNTLFFDRNINWKSAGQIRNKMIITNENNIITYLARKGIFLIKNTNEITKIHDPFFDFNKLNNNNYFYFDNYITYFDIYNNLKALTLQGEIFNKDKTIELLKIYNESNNQNKNNNIIIEQKHQFNKIEKVSFVGNKLLTTDFNIHKRYYVFLTKNMNDDKSKAIKHTLPKLSDIMFINYDADDNSYWYGEVAEEKRRIIIIYDKYGNLVEIFYTKNNAIYDIAPNGDVYILETDITEVEANKGYKLYKVENKW